MRQISIVALTFDMFQPQRKLDAQSHKQDLTAVHLRSLVCNYVSTVLECGCEERAQQSNTALDLAVNRSSYPHLWTWPLGRYQVNERKSYTSCVNEVTWDRQTHSG